MRHDEYHLPVMADEVTGFLVQGPGVYVDGTLGGGGHARRLLEALSGAGWLEGSLLIGIDQDADALDEAGRKLRHFGGRVCLERGNFGDMAAIAGRVIAEKAPGAAVSGILLDLGVSSHQIDTPGRGFSFMSEGPLDMRMDTRSGMTAADMVNTYGEQELAGIFYRYGEERGSRRIARAVKEHVRREGALTRTGELARIVRSVVHGHEHRTKSLARVFQALRIAVNDEMGVLEKALEGGAGLLGPGGRMAVISYHSLEDRMVKLFFREQSADDWGPKGVGLREPVRAGGFREVTRKPVVAGDGEIACNPRARSAKLRILEKKL
ncbi:16S rRNA (cytosine(1402)-N(4))-methyltransferase RsmH [Prosthecochloris sp. N3]|uniref:Ribosomal RNA small subunit methyltransferase H n=1 Tax=Prosthecochloris ethylica TaxID=2743976 RepID=A0ABR9XR27_9CHLB|nr:MULTISPECIES: 16S rRNA (cytosine(1402)-N(4))-methyltransferase RsmH [Prosthecochloris]MBF0586093.1 16S rRNA (cytosine(1402)-N(4))-methyltransferase RsmH [Prosthecochloris ethylica]MBF0636507.1 16S rRNA (cytosine(1402)-N(4))-methyltransferase RsmH [Prosthecochloris ethylica]NUK47139.1 16S rRNA (cytosine(1402)-N(4))-methyltransferase RsmH [Prosthecochloris ethylica]RNA65683.1 16S rRNA (cytosine(1402)-N(4))-methyltransferase RsmH [Prosthecochloris sp. ZM_2]